MGLNGVTQLGPLRGASCPGRSHPGGLAVSASTKDRPREHTAEALPASGRVGGGGRAVQGAVTRAHPRHPNLGLAAPNGEKTNLFLKPRGGGRSLDRAHGLVVIRDPQNAITLPTVEVSVWFNKTVSVHFVTACSTFLRVF